MNKIVCLVLATFISNPLQTDAAEKIKCMLIGAPAGEENAEYDDFIIPILKEMGFDVTKHVSSDLPEYSRADYAPYDFVFLSETTHSSKMSPLRNIPKPMLCSDGHVVKESALAFAKGEPAGVLEPAQPVVFLPGAENHPLAAGYAPGKVVELGKVVERRDPCLLVWGKPTIPVVSIAGVESDPSRLIIYGIEKGSKNAMGEPINHRVAVFGVHAWGYDVLTDDGKNLLKAGIDWVLNVE